MVLYSLEKGLWYCEKKMKMLFLCTDCGYTTKATDVLVMNVTTKLNYGPTLKDMNAMDMEVKAVLVMKKIHIAKPIK